MTHGNVTESAAAVTHQLILALYYFSLPAGTPDKPLLAEPSIHVPELSTCVP
jgi:hypothetical protein